MPNKPAVPPKPVSLPVLSEDQLRRIADYIQRESAAGGVRSTLNIGRYIFTQVFRASEAAFRSLDPAKPDSLADLAAQPGMAEAEWGRTRLKNAVELSLMGQHHNDFRAWRYLRVSHFDVVIGMPPEQQRALLDRADKERWSVARLLEEAGKKKARKPKAASTSTSPQEALRRVRKIAGLLAPLAAEATAVDTFLVPAGLDPRVSADFTETMERALSQLEGIRKQLEQLQQRSAARVKRIAAKVAAKG